MVSLKKLRSFAAREKAKIQGKNLKLLRDEQADAATRKIAEVKARAAARKEFIKQSKAAARRRVKAGFGVTPRMNLVGKAKKKKKRRRPAYLDIAGAIR